MHADGTVQATGITRRRLQTQAAQGRCPLKAPGRALASRLSAHRRHRHYTARPQCATRIGQHQSLTGHSAKALRDQRRGPDPGPDEHQHFAVAIPPTAPRPTAPRDFSQTTSTSIDSPAPIPAEHRRPAAPLTALDLHHQPGRLTVTLPLRPLGVRCNCISTQQAPSRPARFVRSRRAGLSELFASVNVETRVHRASNLAGIGSPRSPPSGHPLPARQTPCSGPQIAASAAMRCTSCNRSSS